MVYNLQSKDTEHMELQHMEHEPDYFSYFMMETYGLDPLFFVLAIVVDGPRWMSSDPFKVGYSNLLIFFKQYIKNKIYFFPFLYLC